MEANRIPRALPMFILGLLMTLIYGGDILKGYGTPKCWFIFIGGLCLIILGVLILFKKDIKNKSPKERLDMSTGIVIGWGACTIVDWVDMDFALNTDSIFRLVCLVILLVVTLGARARAKTIEIEDK